MQLRKTSLLAKLLILAVAIYALFKLVSLQGNVTEMREKEKQLQQQVAYAEQEGLSLQQDIDELGTEKSTIKIARDRLGMVADGEIVFYDSDD